MYTIIYSCIGCLIANYLIGLIKYWADIFFSKSKND